MQVLFDISQEFSELQKFFVHIMSIVREDNPNRMHIGKILPDVRKNVSEPAEE